MQSFELLSSPASALWHPQLRKTCSKRAVPRPRADLAGLTGGTRSRRRPATVRGPRGTSGAGPSGANCRHALAALGRGDGRNAGAGAACARTSAFAAPACARTSAFTHTQTNTHTHTHTGHAWPCRGACLALQTERTHTAHAKKSSDSPSQLRSWRSWLHRLTKLTKPAAQLAQLTAPKRSWLGESVMPSPVQ